MNKKIVVILGAFHKHEGDEMLDEVTKYASENNLDIIDVVWVPGSMEKPFALKKAFMNENVDGAVLLGIIEKGETKHGMIMASSVLNAIINLQLEFMKPAGVGILGPEISPSQIPVRVRPYARAAVVALQKML
jgi:6,7-dimethyl-8-ribityllumazine synthase